jgi:hypothetical protein
LQVSLGLAVDFFLSCHRLPCSVFFALYPRCRRFYRETRISEMAHSRTMDEEHVVDACRLDYFKDTKDCYLVHWFLSDLYYSFQILIEQISSYMLYMLSW